MTPPTTLTPVLLWQHGAAPRLSSLILSKQAWYQKNCDQFWQDWFDNVFNLATADEFGLQVWGIILGIPIGVASGAPQPIVVKPWGFGANNENFGNGNFLPNAGTGSGGVLLSLVEARLLLRLRYFYLTCRPCPVQVNEWFSANAPFISVQDSFDMGPLRYDFAQQMSPQFIALATLGGILPQPSGVGIEISVFGRKVFGFGPDNQNFTNGNFKD